MTLPFELSAWAARHAVPTAAVAELAALLGAEAGAVADAEGSESRVQSEIRLAAPGRGLMLWRNNVGVLPNQNGVPVRYGLANESPALNKRLKSADLIGWRKLEITAAHIGQHVAQFVSFEVKPAGWHFTGAGREEAQARWGALVTTAGGIGRFVSRVEDLP